ncbi:MAG: EI24 domain-containing protein [Bdellovibrionales bacterium]|nr:EI24 domain-containing protein [Bdellovibrionales bacterium]
MGLLACKKGWELVQSNRSVRKGLVLPLTISLIVFVCTVSFSAYFFLDMVRFFSDWVLQQMSLSDDLSQLIWWKKVFVFTLKIILYILSSIFLLIASFALPYLISNIICSWFWELLSEKTMLESGYKAQEKMGSSYMDRFIVPICRELFKELVLLILLFLFWILTLFPGLGPVMIVFIAPVATCFWFGFMIADYAMSIFALSVGDRLRWAQKNFPYVLGLGMSGLIPIVGFFLFPMALVGHSHYMATRKALMIPPRKEPLAL